MTEIAPPWRSTETPKRSTPARGETRGRVGILTGCVQSVVFGSVNAATARVLAADGYEVVAPPQGRRGALSMHAGRAKKGARSRGRVIEAFDGVETVIVNTSGCGSHLKELGHVLGDDPAGRTGRPRSPPGCAIWASSSPRSSLGLRVTH